MYYFVLLHCSDQTCCDVCCAACLQTSEHLAAVEIMRLKDIIILQNKIDLVTESVAQNQHEAIQKFIQGTIAGVCRAAGAAAAITCRASAM